MKIEYGPPAPVGVTQLMAVNGWETKIMYTPIALLAAFVAGAIVYEFVAGDTFTAQARKRRRR